MTSTIPESLRALPREQLLDLDVRADLRDGREPFKQIMAAAASLPAGTVLRVRAIFEPAPLYHVLGRQGFAHATEELGPEDWRVWFYREAASSPTVRPSPRLAEEDPDIVVIDVRDLDPPEPMVRTLDALARLPRGKTLLQINTRVPQFLLPKLRQRGFVHEIREQADVVRVFIRHAEEKVST